MELLILAKLKWDLTAITAYDYLDHLLNALKNSEPNQNEFDAVPKRIENVKPDTITSMRCLLNSATLRLNAEKIILLCATDYRFANLPPSVVASAALMSAIQQEICQNQGSKPHIGPSLEERGQASSSFSDSTPRQILHSGQTLKDINLNQIIARLQILTRFQTVRSLTRLKILIELGLYNT